MWLKFLCIALVTLTIVNAASRDRNNKKYKVVCYLGSWANYRRGHGMFLIEHIDPFLCTHLVYGFAKLGRDNQIAAYDPYLDLKANWGLGAFQRFNNFKRVNAHLTTILAIGGWNEGSVKYSKMASDPTTRKIFVKSCVDFLLKYDFDGLDMDWEYPANRGGEPKDKENFISLLKELKEAFRPHGLILTAAVSAGKKTIDTAYNIAAMGRYLDIINLMAYDFHGSWENVTGHNSPLFPRPEETGNETTLNVDYAVNYWLKGGAPANKIVLGMGLYGRSFTLKKASENGIGAEVSGKGKPGPVTKEGGMLGYNEICLSLKAGWTSVWVDKIDAPYAYHDRQWVGYDNKKSIGLKVDYLMRKNLGGGMVWSIDTDDFRGNCGEKYPLLTLINIKLNGPINRETAPPIVTTPLSIPDATLFPDDGSYFVCPDDGLFRHKKDCSKFYHCKADDYRIYKCGGGNVFDPDKKLCLPRDKAKPC